MVKLKVVIKNVLFQIAILVAIFGGVEIFLFLFFPQIPDSSHNLGLKGGVAGYGLEQKEGQASTFNNFKFAKVKQILGSDLDRLSENANSKKLGIDIKGLMTREFAKMPILGQPVESRIRRKNCSILFPI